MQKPHKKRNIICG